MNGRRRFLTASVISVQNSNFVYPSCQNCFSRLHLDLERFSCLKCGCSGEAGEANYRYRLSLKVADTHGVFLVTVFGSCLEAFFGVTAKSLQRYIEDLNPEAGEAAEETSPSAVIRAVETCFIGKKFIFGVKDSEKQDGANRLQNGSQVGHCPRALTACQMFAPNPGLVGCTVLHYLHQHRRSSGSKGSHGGGWSPGGLFAALYQPSGELSDLPSSGDQDVVPSTHAHCLSSLWPQSFGLTSSSVSGGIAADPAALDSRRTACNEQQWDNSPFSLQHCNQSIGKSQDDNLTANERDVQGGDKFCLCPTWHNSVFVTKEAQSHSSERNDYKAPQDPLEIGKKDSPGKIRKQHSHGLEKSPNPPQKYSFSPLVSCASHSKDGRSSQDDPWFWDELPFSESLSEFIARIENGNTVVSPTEAEVWGYFPAKGAGEIHGRVDQLPPQLDVPSATGQAHEKLEAVAEKVDVSKQPVLSRHQSNQLSPSGKEDQKETSFSALSTQGKDEWECLPGHHRIPLPQLSPIAIKPSGLKGSCLLPKKGADRDAAGRENHHTSSLKAASNCLKSPVHLNSECEDSVTVLRKAESSRCKPKQTACENLDKVRNGQPLPEVHESHCQGGESSNLLWDSSIYPQGSYNASADLFDASTTGAEVVVGTLSTGQVFSAQRGTLTAKPTASGRKPRASEASWSTSRSELSFLDLFAASDPKASTPRASSALVSEHSPSSPQDFVPSSQSTPRVQPRQQARLPQRKASVLSKLALNESHWISAEWKRPFKRPSVKQLFNKFLQSGRPNDVNSATTRELFINGSPAQELSENDDAEWIPPSEKKRRQPLPFQNQKTFRSGRIRDITEKTPFSERPTRWEIPGGPVGLARAEFSPKKRQPAEVNEDVADPKQVAVGSPGFRAFSAGGWPNLSSTPRCAPDSVNWSPELFGDRSQLLTTEAVVKSPTSDASSLLKRALFRPSWSHFQ
ncbi:DNA damage-induced apoptosis suppressor protein [Heteronotia binoei]|uniref:DNA damage-induced apoptosis suppressor protein n=1 Tax=Heteronotia binoei TaxID=13085 RepID=UPI00292E70CF|nr:DNA damage-induced apoptosis suppressor protein [Heteronotia binoei]